MVDGTTKGVHTHYRVYTDLRMQSLWSADCAKLADALQPTTEVIGLVHLVALLIIGSRPGISVNELAESLAIPQQTASRHVSLLLARYQSPAYPGLTDPLIVQEVHSQDPRSRALKLTEAGIQLVRPLVAIRR
jgi:DNA-binding MarR family transcriptional regulator